MFDSIKYGMLSAFALGTALYGDTIGIIGGKNLDIVPNPPMAFFVSSTGDLTPIDLSSVAEGAIGTVAINNFDNALLGGINLSGFTPIAFYVSSTGAVTPLSLSATPSGDVLSVAINDSGIGLIGGGVIGGGTPIAYQVSSSGTPTYIPTVLSASYSSVAINSLGQGIIGGEETSGAEPPIAYFISPDGTPSVINLPLTTKGVINSVAINDDGRVLLGGQDNAPAGPPIAYLATSSSLVSLSFPTQISKGVIESVAINDLGIGLIAGADTSSASIVPLAYRVLSNGTYHVLDVSSLGNAGFLDVALNNAGVGLLGGATATNSPVAVLMHPTGSIQVLDLSSVPNGFIFSVAINDFGAGILGGIAAPFQPFAFLVSPSGDLTPLDFSSIGINSGTVLAVAIQALAHIPIHTLHGNNLIFAKYINHSAPYDAFYFVPSVLDGSLSRALESAAPTRNAISLFTADNNLFFLNQSFSRHSRDSRQLRHEKVTEGVLLAENDELVTDPQEPKADVVANPIIQSDVVAAAKENRPYQVWGELIGVAAYQKAQHQTPEFQPWTGGAILAVDAHATDHGWYGAGAAYTYTHLHEKQGFGHSNINQEYLFVYGMWNNARFYGDVAIWAGLFQIENVRNTHMTGFDFMSKSHPKGWQLAPHAEVGYDHDFSKRLMAEPFAMFDWISNWQHHYRENGNSPFNTDQRKQYSSFLRSEAGVRFYETFTYTNWRLVLQEKGSYVNKKPFHVGRVTGFIVGAPGSFTLETLSTVQNLGAVEMQFMFQPMDTRYPYGTIQYQGEFGANYQSHQLALNICWNF